MRDEGRSDLIRRMLSARTAGEVEAAERAADGWMRENPGDLRVVAAQQRLEERGEKARDPERKANRMTVAAFAVAFVVVALVGFVFTRSPYAALAGGLLVALPVAECVWMFYERCSEDEER